MGDITRAMSTKPGNRVGIDLSVAVLLLGALLVWETWGYFRLYLEAALADGQTQTFDEARTKALTSDAAAAAGLLEYVTIYYPLGSKQRSDSNLDLVVERHRDLVIRDIIQYLRQKTGEDLGDRPDAWAEKYDKNQ